jgi:type IV pilus assembly protein PilW
LKYQHKNQRGFTLIEVLIGVIIALIGIVAMFKVQDNWTRQKRSISSGGDAHIAGTISAFQLERDLRNAGMGFSNSAFMGCTISAVDGARSFSFTLAPVLITNGASGAPDSIAILSGNADTPTTVYQVAGSSTTTTDLKDVYAGLPNGELILLATPGTTPVCRLLEISDQDPNTNSRSIGHDGGNYTRTTKPPVNRTDCTGSASPWSCPVRYTPGLPALASPYSSAPPTYGELRSLGDDPRLNIWAVAAGRNVLTRTDLMHTATAGDVGDGVANLQAQYGLDTNGDGIVDSWVDSTTSWSQIRMVRFALLVRGENYEKDNVNLDTTVSPAVDRVPTWAGGDFVMTNLDGTADSGATNLGVNNWRNYRYNVFEVTVSLRNMIWTHSS